MVLWSAHMRHMFAVKKAGAYLISHEILCERTVSWIPDMYY